MSDDLDTRKKRAAWRAGHRGTKELDLLIGGYAAARIQAMTEADLAAFERLLTLQDTDLQSWLLRPADAVHAVPPEHAALIGAVRAFHGLAAT